MHCLPLWALLGIAVWPTDLIEGLRLVYIPQSWLLSSSSLTRISVRTHDRPSSRFYARLRRKPIVILLMKDSSIQRFHHSLPNCQIHSTRASLISGSMSVGFPAWSSVYLQPHSAFLSNNGFGNTSLSTALLLKSAFGYDSFVTTASQHGSFSKLPRSSPWFFSYLLRYSSLDCASLL